MPTVPQHTAECVEVVEPGKQRKVWTQDRVVTNMSGTIMESGHSMDIRDSRYTHTHRDVTLHQSRILDVLSEPTPGQSAAILCDTHTRTHARDLHWGYSMVDSLVEQRTVTDATHTRTRHSLGGFYGGQPCWAAYGNPQWKLIC